MPLDKIMLKQLTQLKKAVLALKPTGADGFEGLLSTVLTELTGIPFRLAASGIQRGIDGHAAFIREFDKEQAANI